MNNKLLVLICIYAFSLWAVNEPIKPKGDGTETDPYLFERYENFFWLSENSDNFEANSIIYCKQIGDIDATDTQRGYDQEKDINYGWRPVITYNQKGSFVLNYDGQGYSIINPYYGYEIKLYPHGVFSYGIFQLKNIVVKNMHLKGAAYYGSGVLVGTIVSNSGKNSSVENCFTTGIVNLDAFPGSYNGGLIGTALIETNSFLKIINCGSEAFIDSLLYSGGLISHVDCSGGLYIDKCWAKSDLVYDDGDSGYAGGFIGYLVSNNAEINIQNSYSLVKIVKGGNNPQACGFISAVNNRNALSKINISRCYSSGSVDGGNGFRKAFIGVFSTNDYLFISDCFFNASLTKADDNFAIGKTEEEMKVSSTFKNWDFENVWDIDEGESFPYLISQLPEPSFVALIVLAALVYINKKIM